MACTDVGTPTRVAWDTRGVNLFGVGEKPMPDDPCPPPTPTSARAGNSGTSSSRSGPDAAVHWLVLLAGVALWVGAYAATLELTGWAQLAAKPGPEATAARRHAAAVATLRAGVYYGTTWTYGYGGPLLNVIVLAVIVADVPDVVLALSQPTPSDVVLSTAGDVAGRRTTDPPFVADVLTIIVPGGVGLFAPIVLVRRYVWSEAHRERFRDRWPFD